MNKKIYWVFIVVMAALAIYSTEKALGHTTTILAPDGSVTVRQVGSNQTHAQLTKMITQRHR